jgi:hypothetical protein
VIGNERGETWSTESKIVNLMKSRERDIGSERVYECHRERENLCN